MMCNMGGVENIKSWLISFVLLFMLNNHLCLEGFLMAADQLSIMT